VTTHDRLVEGMADLLWERGYVGTSPAAVLERTGVGQGSLYHHFGGKQALAVAAIEANAEVLQAAAREALSPPGTALERLERFLGRDRDVLRGCRIGGLTQDPEVHGTEALHQPVREALAWLRGALTDVIVAGQSGGELDDGIAAADLADTVLATLQGGYVLARADGDAAAFHRAVRGVTALLRTQARPVSGPEDVRCS
jgi:TetR/AcrR family transcriptional repressor of nem operon